MSHDGGYMRTAERIYKALLELAQHHPADKITYAEVAQRAGVHWTTVRRYFGSKEEMRKAVKHIQADRSPKIKDTRTKILEAARTVFARYGYSAATLDQVAQEAGLTKGAVYWHFSSKSDLYLALCDLSLKQLLSSLPDQSEEIFDSSEPRAALSQFLFSEWKKCEHDHGERSLLFLEFITSSRDPAVRKKLNASFSHLFTQTEQILADFKERKLIDSGVDPEALSIFFHALLNGMVMMWLVAPQSIAFDVLAREIAKIIWHGIGPQE